MNILIISEYIAPKQTIGSIRWTKISKYLKKNHQVSIEVLTTKNLEWKVDKLLLADCKTFDSYYEFDKDLVSKLLDKYINQKKTHTSNNVVSTSFSLQKGTIYEPDSLKHKLRVFLQERGMKATAKKAITKYKKNAKKYDVIISSYGPIWCHLAARRIFEMNKQVFWLADFRDIYAGNKYESEKDFKRHKEFVSQYLKNASIISKVAPDAQLYESESQKVIVLPNGYDMDETTTPLPPETFSLVYTGTMYEGETDLTPVFSALSELAANNLINIDDVVIEYAGGSSEQFNQQVKTSGIKAKTIDHGLLPRNKAIELQQRCAILLQASSYYDNFKPLWTGKMFEYMMTKKPIIYSLNTTEHSKISEEMHYIGGVVYESCCPESIDELKDYIWSKYYQWKKTGDVSIEQDEDYVASFSYEHIAEQVWKIINNQLEG